MVSGTLPIELFPQTLSETLGMSGTLWLKTDMFVCQADKGLSVMISSNCQFGINYHHTGTQFQ